MVMSDFCQFCQFVKEPFSEKRLAVTLSKRQIADAGKFGMTGAAVAHHRLLPGNGMTPPTTQPVLSDLIFDAFAPPASK